MSTSVDDGVDNVLITVAVLVEIHRPSTLARTPSPTPRLGGVQVEVRRSARRRRTVSAYLDGTTIVVMIPARFTKAEESEWVTKMVARLGTTPATQRRRSGDSQLARLAAQLSQRYLDGRAVPSSVRWVAQVLCEPAGGWEAG